MSSERPMTPSLETKLQSLSFQSTPQNKGISSHYLHSSRHRQEHYKLYLAEELKHQHIVTFDQFLTDILRLAPDWIEKNTSTISDIRNSAKFQDKVSKYRKPVNHEQDRYAPFVLLANHVVDKIGSNFNFCRNDPMVVKGSSAKRKPDVVTASHKALALDGRQNPDNLMKNGPKANPFTWTELMSFFEFKMIRKHLSKSKREGPNRSAAAAPSTSTPKSPASASPRKLKPPKQKPANKAVPSHSMTTRSGNSSLSPNASSLSSRRPSSTGSSDASRGSMNKNVESEAPANEALLQCASYALEMLSHGGLRSHVLAGLVTDDEIKLLYFDRSINIVSEGLNFLEDLPRFIAMLHAMANLSQQQWGYTKVLEPVPQSSAFYGLKLKLSDGTILKLLDTIFHQHGLIGRGTCVVRAIRVKRGNGLNADDRVWDDNIVVKLSWPAKSRMPEHHIIERARKIADRDEHRWVLNHLPKVLHHQDVDDTLLLSQTLISTMGDKFEERALRIIVQEMLHPITERYTAPELAASYREIFLCYRWLLDHAKIIHRDISLNNMMIRQEGSNVCGVLNDFDLAVYVDAQDSSSKQRTGTAPFMAIDLLRSPDSSEHLYRYDLESLFYVLVWIASRFCDGKEIDKPPLQAWADLGGLTLADKKDSFFYRGVLLDLTPPYKPLRGWIGRMREMIRASVSARTVYHAQADIVATVPSSFDNHTLGGFITLDKFQAIVDSPLA